jgi:hypothetical protein
MSDTRKRLPNARPSVTRELQVGHSSRNRYAISFGGDGETGAIREVFISASRPSDLGSLARDGAILISLALQHGCPLETIAKALTREEGGGPATLLGEVLDMAMSEEGENPPSAPDVTSEAVMTVSAALRTWLHDTKPPRGKYIGAEALPDLPARLRCTAVWIRAEPIPSHEIAAVVKAAGGMDVQVSHHLFSDAHSIRDGRDRDGGMTFTVIFGVAA